MNRVTVRLGTRGSLLAVTQSNWVADQIRSAGHDVEMVIIKTGGDRSQSSGQSLDAMGTVGVFTKEIQSALLSNEIDLTVHSLKDLPTESTPGLVLAAVPPREMANDVLVIRDVNSLSELPPQSRVGTGSVRRASQLRHARSDLEIVGIRGNVDTRLKKLADGAYDAIVLAAAGLCRLGWQDRITEHLPVSMMVPSVGQGALGIETRSDDSATLDIVRALSDHVTAAATTAERTLLAGLRGGCSAPIGSHATVAGDQLQLTTVVLSRDGTQRLFDQRTGAVKDAVGIGQAAVESLLADGAAEIIQQARA